MVKTNVGITSTSTCILIAWHFDFNNGFFIEQFNQLLLSIVIWNSTYKYFKSSLRLFIYFFDHQQLSKYNHANSINLNKYKLNKYSMKLRSISPKIKVSIKQMQSNNVCQLSSPVPTSHIEWIEDVGHVSYEPPINLKRKKIFGEKPNMNKGSLPTFSNLQTHKNLSNELKSQKSSNAFIEKTVDKKIKEKQLEMEKRIIKQSVVDYQTHPAVIPIQLSQLDNRVTRIQDQIKSLNIKIQQKVAHQKVWRDELQAAIKSKDKEIIKREQQLKNIQYKIEHTPQKVNIDYSTKDNFNQTSAMQELQIARAKRLKQLNLQNSKLLEDLTNHNKFRPKKQTVSAHLYKTAITTKNNQQMYLSPLSHEHKLQSKLNSISQLPYNGDEDSIGNNTINQLLSPLSLDPNYYY